MIAKLENNDIQNIMIEWPIRGLSTESGITRNTSRIDTPWIKASFHQIRTSRFCISENQVICPQDTRIHSKPDEFNGIWFCAVVQGNITCLYQPTHQWNEWHQGEANLLSYDGIEACVCMYKDTPFRMREIMLSTDYIKELATQYPDLLSDCANHFLHGQPYRAYRSNRPFCSSIHRALNDIMQSHISGNVATLYADAKIREILSLFLSQAPEKDGLTCPCFRACDDDKIHHAKAIIEQEYLTPPSLHELALRIGTNECSLKRGFKALFGTTVFGYIFDYRMNLASRYLLDTNQHIQDIALSVGYEHHPHFSTAFKRKFGLSPLEYRLQHISNTSLLNHLLF